jgi:amino acid adenylation domain-containing protein
MNESPKGVLCLQDLWHTAVARTPAAVAVVHGVERRTYAELDVEVRRLAGRLQAHGVGPEARVGLALPRGVAQMIGVLAILAAGGACVPLDPTLPATRLAAMIGDAGLACVISMDATELPLPAGLRRVDPARAVGDERRFVAPQADPEHLAYVLFTSGSTGRPKGVAMPHRGLVRLIAWQLRTSKAAAMRTLQFAPLGFDVAFQELFAAWAGGGALVLIDETDRRDPERLLAVIAEQQVERLFMPFVALAGLAEAAERDGRALPDLVEVHTAGEQLVVSDTLRRFMRRCDVRLTNQYGPTEAHVVSCHALAADTAAWPELPPIGAGITGAALRVFDPGLIAATDGAAGELFLAGECLARGYLGRPGLTAERFVPDPSGPPGSRMYRTGDAARLASDGEAMFLGRLDAQVKVRGHRVELGEVEAALARHAAVEVCAATVRSGPSGHARLLAFVVLRAGVGEEGLAAVREHAREVLPAAMVPHAIEAIAGLPRTASGKIARALLPDVSGRRPALAAAYVAPRTELERRIAAVWCELLAIDRVGIDDPLFELGADSLVLAGAAARLTAACGAGGAGGAVVRARDGARAGGSSG